MSDLQSRMSGLSPAKRALLERKLRDKAVRQEREPIRPGSAGPKPPLSFGQQRLWFLDQWEPGSAAYNISNVFRVDGSLDAAALEYALTEIVRRHEALRTTFASEGTTPLQIIHPPEPFTVRNIDLTAIASEQKDAETRKQIIEETTRPFDLQRAPLFRCAVLTPAPEKHLLLFTIHHIASDGWSMGVLYRELSALYSAFVRGQSSPLPELPIQYADFAVWQRQYLQGEIVAEQLSYWREALRDLPTLDLPTDHPRPPMQTFTGSAINCHMPRPLIDGVKSLARQEAGTLFMALLAAFQTLLHRYTGQDDIVVGAPIAGRTRVELEPLIGFFVNMLVLRTVASGDPTFREFMGRVRKVAVGAYAYQEVPFEKLVEEVQPRRDASRNPLFQVVLALQNTPGYSLSLGGVDAERITTEKMTTRFDLEVYLLERQGGLDATFIYNTALFESGTIARMARHFQTLLEGIAANPDQRLSQLPILTEEEKHQLLVAWNQTETDYPRNACIHELFTLQAKAFPDHIAVAFRTQSLTYRQLNERSNQLAHQLSALGVGPDVLVGICAERSVDMIVGFLGTLKSGGAYVPLDPAHPRERLAFMIEDANVRVLLTQEKLRSQFAQTAARVVCLDTESFDTFPRENPSAAGTAENLAYVIYTSGSTGQPKGVAVAHRAVTRVVLNTNYVQLTPSDRITQVCNASFDVAAFEIWGALLNGATLIGIPQEVLLSPKDFAREIQDQRITTLFLTAALLNQMAVEVPAGFQSLRYLVVGGDVCDPKSTRKILEHGPPKHFLNAYGPTEGAVFATCHRVETVAPSATSVPIGRPISNTRVFVLDRNLQPVPIGIVGELYIGGDAVAREYLNRPELTAAKFIQDPFSSDPSQRLYRTGDFVRYLADGNIDFLGRMDQQIKVRGFRIELQEIETVLSQHPGVSRSIVVAKQKNESEKRVLAYVVPSENSHVAIEDLRRFLRTKLPEYMVPSAFIALQSVPLTPNGKVDLAALPDPEEIADDRSQRFVDPHTSTEERLAEMWKELLGITRVSMDDNFFNLGGHSLLAIQLITRIEKAFDVSLPVATLFQYPTIAELAKVLESEAWPESWSSLIPVQPEGSKLPFFWVHGDSSNGVLPEYLGPDQPLYALEHQGHDGSPAAYTEVETIAKHYLDEVRTVRPDGPYLIGGFSFGALIAFEMAQQLKREGAEVPFIFLLDPPCFEKEDELAVPSPAAWQEFKRHWRELSHRRGREKLDYVAPRLKDQLSGRTSWMTRLFRRLRRKYCLLAGRRMPVSLRSDYILDVYSEALRSYVAQPYSGRVILYKSRKAWYPPSLDWFKLITGDLTVYEGPGGHMDLRIEPYVAQWAERLKAALEMSCEL